jgi:hypothetical protein
MSTVATGSDYGPAVVMLVYRVGRAECDWTRRYFPLLAEHVKVTSI